MIGTDHLGFAFVQRSAAASAEFQRCLVLVRHELRKNHFAEVVEQACNIAIARIGFRQWELHAKLARESSGGE